MSHSLCADKGSTLIIVYGQGADHLSKLKTSDIINPEAFFQKDDIGPTKTAFLIAHLLVSVSRMLF